MSTVKYRKILYPESGIVETRGVRWHFNQIKNAVAVRRVLPIWLGVTPDLTSRIYYLVYGPYAEQAQAISLRILKVWYKNSKEPIK